MISPSLFTCKNPLKLPHKPKKESKYLSLHNHFPVADMRKHYFFLDFTMQQVQLAKNTPKTWKMSLLDWWTWVKSPPGSFRSWPNQLFNICSFITTTIPSLITLYSIIIYIYTKKLLNGHRTIELQIIMIKSHQVLLSKFTMHTEHVQPTTAPHLIKPQIKHKTASNKMVLVLNIRSYGHIICK